jgi:putative endonuclease
MLGFLFKFKLKRNIKRDQLLTIAKQKSSLERGLEAEEEATQWLKSHGLQLLVRNYRTRLGEIDLIMRDQNEIVFVEVRLRLSSIYVPAAHTIVLRKQHRIQKAAEHYLQRFHGDAQPYCRFDVMASDGKSWQWIKNAFSARPN